MRTCFSIYFQPIYCYLKKVTELAFDNDNLVLMTTVSSTAIIHIIQEFLNINYFGVTNLTLLLVIANVLVDAKYGIKKSLMESSELLSEHDSIAGNTPEKKALYKKHLLKKFDPKKLQYTFFKVLTLLAYLFFVKTIIVKDFSDDIIAEIIGFSSAVILKAPILIFWYYDFKSIGDNTAYIYKKKAPIFIIAEKIFEPKLKDFFKNKNTDYEN